MEASREVQWNVPRLSLIRFEVFEQGLLYADRTMALLEKASSLNADGTRIIQSISPLQWIAIDSNLSKYFRMENTSFQMVDIFCYLKSELILKFIGLCIGIGVTN